MPRCRARWAGSRRGSPASAISACSLDRGRHAAELKAVLGGIKGPLMKVAQLLATIPDALPKEYVQELLQLQANAPAMGWPFVRRRMTGELGADWQSRFRHFDRAAARAASLGQVHRATALDGTALACKLQYPDMASAVEADLQPAEAGDGPLRTLRPGGHDRRDPRRDLRPVARGARLRARGRAYAALSRDPARRARGRGAAPDPRAVDRAPVDDDLARGRADPRYREGAARRCATRSRCGCSGSGTCRSTITASSTATRISAITRSRRTAPSISSISAASASSRLVSSTASSTSTTRSQRDDRDLAVHAYRSWGFGNLSNEMIDVLNRWACFVYGPLLDDRERLIQERGERRRWRRRWSTASIATSADSAGSAAARIRLHGPRRDRARLGLSAPEGRDQLVPAVSRADRRFRRRRRSPRASRPPCRPPGCRSGAQPARTREAGWRPAVRREPALRPAARSRHNPASQPAVDPGMRLFLFLAFPALSPRKAALRSFRSRRPLAPAR